MPREDAPPDDEFASLVFPHFFVFVFEKRFGKNPDVHARTQVRISSELVLRFLPGKHAKN